MELTNLIYKAVRAFHEWDYPDCRIFLKIHRVVRDGDTISAVIEIGNGAIGGMAYCGSSRYTFTKDGRVSVSGTHVTENEKAAEPFVKAMWGE